MELTRERLQEIDDLIYEGGEWARPKPYAAIKELRAEIERLEASNAGLSKGINELNEQVKAENAKLREALTFIKPYIEAACLTSKGPIRMIEDALGEKP